jgi:anti-sigma factor RsiW
MNSNGEEATHHDQHTTQIVRYVLGEMHEPEAAEFSRHLEGCERCRAQVEEEIALSRLFRATAPLYVAPQELHSRVHALVSKRRLRNGSEPPIRHAVSRLLEWTAARWVPVLSFAVLALFCIGISRRLVAEFRARDYVEAAVAAHVSMLHRQLPLEVQSSDPEIVTQWVDQRVSFPFRLPAAQAAPEMGSRFRLTGARLIELKRGRGVMVTYYRQDELVTLLAAPDSAAVVAGGEQVQDGHLLFHYRSHAGFNVITWYNHGLAYALVSSVAGPARQSCLVCHRSLSATE